MVELLLTLDDTFVQMVVAVSSRRNTSDSVPSVSNGDPVVSSLTNRNLIFSPRLENQQPVNQFSNTIHPGTPFECMCGGYVCTTADTFSLKGGGWGLLFFFYFFLATGMIFLSGCLFLRARGLVRLECLAGIDFSFLDAVYV